MSKFSDSEEERETNGQTGKDIKMVSNSDQTLDGG